MYESKKATWTNSRMEVQKYWHEQESRGNSARPRIYFFLEVFALTNFSPLSIASAAVSRHIFSMHENAQIRKAPDREGRNKGWSLSSLSVAWSLSQWIACSLLFALLISKKKKGPPNSSCGSSETLKQANRVATIGELFSSFRQFEEKKVKLQ